MWLVEYNCPTYRSWQRDKAVTPILSVTLLRAEYGQTLVKGFEYYVSRRGAMASLRQQEDLLVLRWTSKLGHCLIQQFKRSCSEAIKEKAISDKPLTE